MAEQQIALEADMIRQAQNGSQEAYRRLYERYTDAIYHYIHKRVGESCDAEDLTQAVFVKAWQALRDYQISGAPFQAWLYRIAHNAVVDHYRTRRDPLLWDDLTWMADPSCTPENRILQAEQQAVVQNAIAELRPAYREVIVRRFLHNLDYAETAAELGQQVNNIRVLQHRALEALRRVLSTENALRLTSVVAVLCLLLGGRIVVAAEQALPGDQLYRVRTGVEDVRLFLADDAGDLRLHTDFATQRMATLTDLAQQNRADDLATLVADLTAHLQAATTTFRALPQAQPNRPALTAHFAQAVQHQSATLHALVNVAPPAVQTTLQPALQAVDAAKALLPVSQSVLPTPSAIAPTAPAPAVDQPQERSSARSTPVPLHPGAQSQVAPAVAQQPEQPAARADSSQQRLDSPRANAATRSQAPAPTVTQPSPAVQDTAEAQPAGSPRPEPGTESSKPRPGHSATAATTAPPDGDQAAADRPAHPAQSEPAAAKHAPPAAVADQQNSPVQPPVAAPGEPARAAPSASDPTEADQESSAALSDPPAEAASAHPPDQQADADRPAAPAPEAENSAQAHGQPTTDQPAAERKPEEGQPNRPDDAPAQPADRENRSPRPRP